MLAQLLFLQELLATGSAGILKESNYGLSQVQVRSIPGTAQLFWQEVSWKIVIKIHKIVEFK